jgi:hypothetical protein
LVTRQQRARPIRPPGTETEVDTTTFPNAPATDDFTVWFMPNDNSTMVATSPLGLGIEGPATEVPTDLVASVAAAVSIVTYPELTPVDTHAEVAQARAQEGAPARATVTLEPTSPLTDRWYAVRLPTMGSNLHMAAFQPHRRMPDGSVVARFRPGSEPVISGVRICGPRSGSYRVLVDTSEQIAATDRLVDSIRLLQGGRPVACRAVPSFEPYANGHSLIVDCDGFDPDRPFDVAVRDDLLSMDGSRRLRGANLTSKSVRSLQPFNTGCWRMLVDDQSMSVPVGAAR